MNLEIANAEERGSFSIIDFYNRRIRRIFPALIVIMAASLIFGWFALFSDEFRELGKQIVAGVGFLANIALFRESGYFDTAAETKPMPRIFGRAVGVLGLGMGSTLRLAIALVLDSTEEGVDGRLCGW